MANEEIYGVDYSSDGEVTSTGDIMVVEGLDNAYQAIRNQLLTPIGSYPSVDTEYGSEIYEIWGEDLTRTQLQELEVYIENALMKQERIQEIESITIRITDDGSIKCELDILLVNGTEEEIEIELD